MVDLAVELEVAAKGERAGPVRRARLEAVPGMFVLTSTRSEDALLERENYAACCCAAQNLMLYLWAARYRRQMDDRWHHEAAAFL